MSSPVKPALERLDQALRRLETAVEEFQSAPFGEDEEQAEASAPVLKAERDISQLVARKLDSAIDRLEALLSGE